MEMVYETEGSFPAIGRDQNGDLYLFSRDLPCLICGAKDIASTNEVLRKNSLPNLEEWFAYDLPLRPLIDFFDGVGVVAIFGSRSSEGAVGLQLAQYAKGCLLNLTGRNTNTLIVDMVRAFRQSYRAEPERHRKIQIKSEDRWEVIEIKLREQIAAYETSQT